MREHEWLMLRSNLLVGGVNRACPNEVGGNRQSSIVNRES